MILAPPLKFPTLQDSIFVANTSTAAPLASAYTLVTKYLPRAIQATGQYVRLVVVGPATGSMTLSNTYIGIPATSGNIPSFAGAQVRVTWDNGQNSKTISDAGIYVSDVVSFNVLDTTPVIIAYDVTSGSSVRFRSGLSTDYVSYVKSGGSDAATTSKSGYTPVGSFSYITQILQVNL